MKVCTNCNNTYDERYTSCPSCGAPAQSSYPVYAPANTKEPVSIGGWIGRSLIPLIPLVGGIVYLIMLFIWSGDTKKEDTFRNWAKAQLIVMAIALVLAIILGVAFSSVFMDIIESL